MVKTTLSVEGLSYTYGRRNRALEDIEFKIRPGKFTALLGPNGAGKTTLMALITGLFANPRSKVEICGYDLSRDSRSALSHMGVVFQRPTLDLDLNVQQNLIYAAKLYGLPSTLADQRVAANLERLGLIEKRRAPVRTLSGGMRRRVELARALLHEPDLLVLDEPTVGLDIDSRRQIVAYVHALCRERNLAVLWTTHLIDEISGQDHVIMLAQGKIVEQGSIDELVDRANAEDLGGAYQYFCKGKVAA